MQELHLVSVDAETSTLVLSDESGTHFTLALNDDIRAALKTHPTPLAKSGGDAAPPSPRDIQARIRAGASAAEVAQETGAPLSMVQRFEGPVLAEREYIASRAQGVIVAEPDGLLDGYREAFGNSSANLGEMVAHRLEAFGADADSATWDAFKREDGSWNVVLAFELGEDASNTIGEPPLARWIFKASSASLSNANRWAQVLSEMEPIDGPLPSRRLVAVPSSVFDVETSGTDPSEVTGTEPATDGSGVDDGHDDTGPDEHSELLDMLMERRGQRLGTDEISDDALAAMIAKGPVPGAKGDASEDSAAGKSGKSDSSADELEGQQQLFGGLRLAPEPKDDPINLQQDVDTDTASVDLEREKPAAEDDAGADNARAKRGLKHKRSSVPSWDEIVFGAKND